MAAPQDVDGPAVSGRLISDGDDNEISRCECHGAWTWQGRCRIDRARQRTRRRTRPAAPADADNLIRQFAAEQAARRMGHTA